MAHAARLLLPAAPVRCWRVDLAPSRDRWVCAAPGCPGAALEGQHAPQVALRHLAAHAADERLAPHLRTCRCQAHGCLWHPRHRGCDGTVALVVFRSHGGATWQLADACTGCSRAIPHAARLPAPPAPRPSRPRAAPGPSAARHHTAAAAEEVLEPVLAYLDAALARHTTATVRRLALLCLLRANHDGAARLPAGLLRGWRLAGGAQGHLAELARQNWLREEPSPGPAGVSVQIGDPLATIVLRGLGRRNRKRLLHQAGPGRPCDVGQLPVPAGASAAVIPSADPEKV